MSYLSKYNKRDQYPVLDYGSMVSHGMIPGHSFVSKFGLNYDLDTVEETIWGAGGLFDPSSVTGAETLNIVSTSTQDTNLTGTGAWLVAIFGLDEDYNEISEFTTALNGTSTVTSTNQYRAINRVAVSYSGTNNANVGTITFIQDTSGIKLAEVKAEAAITEQLIYTVPAGKTAYLKCIDIDAGKTSGGTAEIEIFVYTFNPASNTRYKVLDFVLDTAVQDNITFTQDFANPTSEKVTFYINAVSNVNNVRVFGRFFMDLIENK